jgi:hypothetical protein
VIQRQGETFAPCPCTQLVQGGMPSLKAPKLC